MLTTTDRKGIRDSIKQWSQRRNIPDEVLNDFIELAISKASRALRIPPLEGVSTPEVLEGGYVEIPQDFIEVKELKVIRGNKAILLERKAIHEVDHLADRAGSGVEPCIFGRFGNFLRIAPMPIENDEVRLYYNKIIPAMTNDTDTNWFTLYAPEVLLYGAMSELASYTRDNEGQQRWDGKFNEAVNIIQGVEDRAMWNGSTIAISLGGST